jgi:hypothetical protein
MDRTLIFRRLRIATSMFFALIAVALCLLWVRSYRTCDTVSIRDARSGHFTFLGSNSGTMFLHRSVVETFPYPGSSFPRYSYSAMHTSEPQAVFVWNSNFLQGPVGISFPYWLPTLVAALTAAIPWLRCHFSLRTMLIATTLVAVALGLGVWVAA